MARRKRGRPPKDESFDLVNSITVLQHIPQKEKKEAIKEMCRVTKKGGYITIIELVDKFDDEQHMFVVDKKDIIKEFEKNGCKIIKIMGVEYIPLVRLLRYMQFRIKGKKTINRKQKKVNLNFFEWWILKISLLVSYPIEHFLFKLNKNDYARNICLLIRK